MASFLETFPKMWKGVNAASFLVFFWSALGYAIFIVYNLELRSFIIGQQFYSLPNNIFELTDYNKAIYMQVAYIPQGILV